MTQSSTKPTTQAFGQTQALAVQTTRTLAYAIGFALLFAALVLTVAILPAQYNIDPTGLGKAMGLTALADADSAASTSVSAGATTANESDSVEIKIPVGKGLEYKFNVEAGEKLSYVWTSDVAVYFDFHGEPAGDTTGYFESFTIATSNDMRGTLTAPFTGSHGWYWKNESDKVITVSLQTEGSYQIIGLKK